MPNQSNLSYRFEPLASQDPFEVVSFTLDEALSTPFRLVLELVSYKDNVDFGHLLDKPALFTILRGQRPQLPTYPALRTLIDKAVHAQIPLTQTLAEYTEANWRYVLANLPQSGVRP